MKETKIGIIKLSFILGLAVHSAIEVANDINMIFQIEQLLKKDNIIAEEKKKAKEPSKVLLKNLVLPIVFPTNAALVSDIETIKRPAVADSIGNMIIDIKEPIAT